MIDFTTLRSLLYVPASNEKALVKAVTLDADAFIIDLEDAVAPELKITARARAISLLEAKAFSLKPVFLRVNGFESEFAVDDFAAAAGCILLDGIVLPKVSSPADIIRAEPYFLNAPKNFKILAMIETPLAFVNLREIGALSNRTDSRLAGFILGLNDLLKDTGIDAGDNRNNIKPLLLQSVLVAKAYKLAIYDGVFNQFQDISGFETELLTTKALGFHGKTLVHPSQITPVKQVFCASHAEILAAKQIVDAFALPENAEKGAINLNGGMVERLHLEMAQHLLNNNGLNKFRSVFYL